jgi:dipeptidyl aminopeptidase/acylaminoacyl peptidase
MFARVTPLAAAPVLALMLIGAAPSATVQAAPAIYSIRPDGTGRALVLRLAPPVYLLHRSQDGKQIVFSRDGNPEDGLYVTDISGKDPVGIRPGGYPTFSPDGTRLALSSSTGLYVVNSDDTGRQLVTEAGASPSWSPEGRRLAYMVGGNRSLWSSTIHVASADGGNDIQIATGIYPTWAPRGNRIAYLGLRRGYAVPCFVDSDGSHRMCYHGFSINNGFVWSPDGKRIAFFQAYPSRLAVVTARGQHIRRFPNRRRARTRILAWSPDGRWLAYSKERASTQIYIRPVDRPGGERRVTAESRSSFLSTFEVRWVLRRISYIIFE